MTSTISRRDFVKTGALASAGLLIGFRLSDARELDGLATAAADFTPNAYLKIGTDGTVTLFADHVELGQGVMTALPMIVAEELDADWSKVRIERMPDDPSTWPRAIMTVGSQSVRGSWQPLRRAGATAREMLISAAAQQWGVDRPGCRTEKGFVLHDASGRRASYGELATAAAAITPPQEPPLKDPKDYRIIGTSAPRVDIPSKVDGSATYGIDVHVPGMLVATVVRPPVAGAVIKRIDETAARIVPGVKDVVRFERGVAVVATDTWSALKGRRALVIEWSDPTSVDVSSAEIRRVFTQLAASPGAIARNDGDVEGALRSARNTLTVDYELPFAAHATMEPANCTAHVRSDGVDVWVPTQAPTSFQRAAALIAGVRPNDVRVHVTAVGGGFGRRSRTDVLEDAVRLSKRAGAPIKVMWTREDDMQHDAYRPFGIHRMSGAVGSDGWPVAWMHRVVTQAALGGGRGSDGQMAVNGDAV
ncbi:MAG TPA: molybdopterin cofactor-binding domain-containing protein, partial [Gemmatimonadaceae bacterium]|nr:molybdopterin cofactor-binding domain-containing protein [Gemmatimonadaceae bacterium]